MDFSIFAQKDNSLLNISVENSQETLIKFAIRNMTDAQIMSVKGGDSINIRNGDLSIIIFKHDDTVVVQFTNKTASPEGQTLQFNDDIEAIENNSFSVSGIFVLCERSTCMVSNNQLSIYPSGTHSIVTLYMPNDAAKAMTNIIAMNVKAMSSGTYVVTSNGVLPEFSIAVFDDVSRTVPRPMRLGVPVISTVPIYRAGLSESELQVIEIGLGTKKRTMYFKIISNVVIPDDVEPVLHIYLPAGLDTVDEPVSVEMTRQVSTDSTRSVFYASYAFHKEDTLNYVDGFAYFSVYMPMEINTDLPVAMAVTATGAEITDQYEDSPLLG
jgi:hypothetical protein